MLQPCTHVLTAREATRVHKFFLLYCAYTVMQVYTVTTQNNHSRIGRKRDWIIYFDIGKGCEHIHMHIASWLVS